jgi:hypothetical protein
MHRPGPWDAVKLALMLAFWAFVLWLYATHPA